MSQDGAFDGVLDGLDAILHTASPFRYDVEDPEGREEPQQSVVVVRLLLTATNRTHPSCC